MAKNDPAHARALADATADRLFVEGERDAARNDLAIAQDHLDAANNALRECEAEGVFAAYARAEKAEAERDAARRDAAEIRSTLVKLLKDHHVGHGAFPRAQCGVCKPIDEALTKKDTP